MWRAVTEAKFVVHISGYSESMASDDVSTESTRISCRDFSYKVWRKEFLHAHSCMVVKGIMHGRWL